MEITNLFGSISQKMRADFDEARTAFTHSGLKGTAFENTVKSFLRAYLPEKLNVCSGQLIDAEGRISKQLDVIIYDAHGTPILKQTGDLQVIPVECAYSVIEVKAHLSRNWKVRTPICEACGNFGRRPFLHRIHGA